MKFIICEKYSDSKKKFCIYNHSLTMLELEKNISEMIFSEATLNYLFNGSYKNIKKKETKLKMLRRFIPEDFINKEKNSLLNWNDSAKVIDEGINNNNGYYSFFSEALMAYLNYKYLDNKLAQGILILEDTLSDQHTGVDACMFSEDSIILGEAKFYGDFNSAKKKIIDDFSDKKLNNKIKNLYRKSVQSRLKIKPLSNDITIETFKSQKIILCGFILHNQSQSYEYKDVNKIDIDQALNNYSVALYHLPINDKRELIHKIIKRAMEVIVVESR